MLDVRKIVELIDGWNEKNEAAGYRDRLRKEAGWTRDSSLGQLLVAAIVREKTPPEVDDELIDSHFTTAGFPIGDVPENVHALAVRMEEEGFEPTSMREIEKARDWIRVARLDPTTRFSELHEQAQKFWKAVWNAYRSWKGRQIAS